LAIRLGLLEQFALEAKALRAVVGCPLEPIAVADRLREFADRHRPSIRPEQPPLHQLGVVVRLPDLLRLAADHAAHPHLRVAQELRFGLAIGGEAREVREHGVDLAHR
jgi:hypothetical protein